MKILIPLDALDQYKSRDPIPFQCYMCQKTFFKPKNEVLDFVKNGKANRALKFCSRNCKSLSEIDKIEGKCQLCNKSIAMLPSEHKRSKNHFCSMSCAATYNNTHKTKGTRRSKLEKWIEKMLILLYPSLLMEFNSKTTIQSELDIYIPSLKLAFELNGIYHYEPIHGNDKFKKIQINDTNKFQACISNGINLCVIDTSHQLYFKEQTAQVFLSIIINIINANLK